MTAAASTTVNKRMNRDLFAWNLEEVLFAFNAFACLHVSLISRIFLRPR